MATLPLSTHSVKLHSLSPLKSNDVRKHLLEWYSANARSMPWRLPPVPFSTAPYPAYVQRLYVCLLSETMLQQTQVATVTAYFVKWLALFPTLQDLANATEEQVMAAWAGLGYYSRAKRLHQAAQFLIEDIVSKSREFPYDPEYWIKKVPGVGPYTAGAIISQSFDVPSAIVDGNVQRVLSRVLAIHGDTTTPKSAGSKMIWQCASELVIGDNPGELNQSMMELGATLCTPTLPSCKKCPVNSYCEAYRALHRLTLKKPTISKLFAKQTRSTPKAPEEVVDVNDIEDVCSICPTTISTAILPANPATYIQSLYPYKLPKKVQRQETAIVYILHNDANQIYLEKKAKGLLAGLFDFPTQLLDAKDDVEAVTQRCIDECAGLLKGESIHLFTHIRRSSKVIFINHCASAEDTLTHLDVRGGNGRWVSPESLPELGVSELCLKNWRVATGVAKQSGKRKADVTDRNKLQQQQIRKVAKRPTVDT